MPKPLLRKPETQTQSNNILSATYTRENRQNAKQMNQMQLDRVLRKTRSKAYMDALAKLDAGGHTHNQKQIDDLMEVIRAEFPEVELEGILLGFVSKCYLGDDYEVHTVDITGRIIEHYKKGHPLPGGLEKARSIAIRGGYAYIEVYVDCCRCVAENGTVSVIKG